MAETTERRARGTTAYVLVLVAALVSTGLAERGHSPQSYTREYSDLILPAILSRVERKNEALYRALIDQFDIYYITSEEESWGSTTFTFNTNHIDVGNWHQATLLLTDIGSASMELTTSYNYSSGPAALNGTLISKTSKASLETPRELSYAPLVTMTQVDLRDSLGLLHARLKPPREAAALNGRASMVVFVAERSPSHRQTRAVHMFSHLLARAERWLINNPARAVRHLKRNAARQPQQQLPRQRRSATSQPSSCDMVTYTASTSDISAVYPVLSPPVIHLSFCSGVCELASLWPSAALRGEQQIRAWLRSRGRTNLLPVSCIPEGEERVALTILQGQHVRKLENFNAGPTACKCV